MLSDAQVLRKRNKRPSADGPMDSAGRDNKRILSCHCASQHCALSYKRTLEREQCNRDESDWCLDCKANWEKLKLRQGFNPDCKDVSHFFNHGGALRCFEDCEECGVVTRIEEISHSICLDCSKKRKAARAAAEAKEVQATLSEEETRPDMSVCLFAFGCALRAMKEAKSLPVGCGDARW